MYLLLVPVALAIPAIGLVVVGKVTDNPYLQPLGLSREKLATSGEIPETVAIIVQVDWGEDYPGAVTQYALQETISHNLTFRTDEFVFLFNDVPGDRVGITFKVSHNEYGPFSPNGWLDGMVTALIALQAVEKSRAQWGPA